MTVPPRNEGQRVLTCCAACLHAITDPERPVQFDGCFFHASHLPAAASVGWF